MRVFYVIDGLRPGGAEQSLLELLPRYLESGVRPVVVCLRGLHNTVAERVHASGCEVRVLPGAGWLGRILALRRMIRRERPELVHTTLYNSDVVGRLAAAGSGVPVLTSLVNTTYDDARRGDPNVSPAGLWLSRALDGWTARHLTTHFHAITHAVKASAVASLGIAPEKVTVIERGRTAERMGSPGAARRIETRRRLGVSEDAEVVVNVARQDFQKGQKYLLEATALLAEARPRLVVLIAGREGSSSAELSKLHERLRLGGRVRFLGNRDDVPEILAAADVFAFPSVYEGLGGALIEAMALALPIVASDLSAVREVLEDGANAILVPAADPSAMAAALGRLLDDPELRRRYGARSARMFEERFTIDRSASRMVALYRRLGDGAARSLKGGAPAIPSASAGKP